MAEEAADALRGFREAAHMADDAALQLRTAAGQWLARDRLLEIAVDTFVRVELRAVGREVEDLDLRGMLG